jgi:hypothetical protein
MSEKEKRELNIKDFKYSFNKYHKVYRVEIFQHGKWGDCKFGEKIFKNSIKLKLYSKDNLRNKPYKPYFYFRAKWSYLSIENFLNRNEKKIDKIKKNAVFWFGIIIPIIATSIALISVKDAREERQQILQKTKHIRKIEKEIYEEKEMLESKILKLTNKIDSVHLDHLENIRVLEKMIEKKK